MTVNEDDSAIKQILPIVMLAYKGSDIAQERMNRSPSMMFFVYSKVNTSELAKSKVANIRQKLLLELKESVQGVEGLRIGDDPSPNLGDFLSFF